MYATKRKIKHLLDAATGTKSSSRSSNPIDPPADKDQPSTTASTPPKKRRLDASTPSSIRPISRGDSQTTHTSPSKTPTYCPWDRPAFLARLASFRSVDLWGAKSEEMGEVEWAKRGWECVGRERVRCKSCRREVVVSIEGEEGEEENGEEVMEELVRRYKVMVVEGHDESCLWRKRGCEASIYHLPLAKPSVSIPAFLTRYQSLLPVLSSIPTTLTSPLTTPLHLPSLPEDAPANSPSPSVLPHHPTLLTLALFGWECEDPSIPLLTCNACFRRLGLWLFTPKPTETTDDEEDAVLNCLDVRGEHREYCPWVCRESQGREEGWRTLEGVVRRAGRVEGDVGGAGAGAGDGAEGQEEKENMESRLKRLRTVYFGKGKKLKKKEKGEKEKEKAKK